MDIGGGSIELTALKSKKILKQESFPLGTVRLLNNPNDIQKFPLFLDQFKSGLPRSFRSITLLGTGGNFRAWGKLAKTVFKISPHSREIKPHHLHLMAEQISSWDLEQKMKKLYVRKDRAEVLIPSYELIKAVDDLFSINLIQAPRIGLIDGMAVDFLSTHRSITE